MVFTTTIIFSRLFILLVISFSNNTANMQVIHRKNIYEVNKYTIEYNKQWYLYKFLIKILCNTNHSNIK